MADYDLMAQALADQPPGFGYGLRYNMGKAGEPLTLKGKGYFGEMKTAEGYPMGEYSGISSFNGKDVEHPFIVPTLNKQELDLLRMTGEVSPEIARKAQLWAQGRIEQGKDPFATQGDIRLPYPSE